MSTPTPEQFLTEAPPRIMGTECEYSYQGVSEQRMIHNNEAKNHVILGDLGKALEIMHLGQYLSNGARLYPDVGNLEYATPECLGPREAVAADFAGAAIMYSLFEKHTKDTKNTHMRLYRSTGSFMEPNGSQFSAVTRGFHENYQIPQHVASSSLLKAVLPSFFASRIWSGSGAIGQSGYMFLQKAPGIATGKNATSYSLDSRTVHGQKPMLIVTPPDNIYCAEGAEKWRRVEVRLADAGHSMDAQFLAKAASSLVLRLIEHGDEYHDAIVKLALKNPGESARDFNRDLTLKETSRTVEHASLSALDIQEAFFEQAAAFADKFELPDDERAAVALWEETLSDLRLSDPVVAYYPKRLMNRFDFAARHHYLARREGTDRLTTTNTSALHRSFVWDRVHPEGGASRIFNTLGSEYVTKEEVEELVVEPPQKTRAKTRSVVIKNARHGDKVDWSRRLPNGSRTWQSLGSVYLEVA